MADNTTLPTGSGGDAIRDIDRAGVKTQVVILDIGGQAGPESLATSANPLPTTISGTVPLPTGASTAARQDTGNTSLSSIDGKLPAQGQALAAASVPVVLPAAQITTLTPLSTITANQGGAPWSQNLTQVSGVAIATGAGTAAGTIRVELPTNGTGVVGLNAGSAVIGSLTANQSVNVNQIAGAAPSVSNPLPVRITNGTVFASITSRGGDNYQEVAQIQDVVASTVNSSVANLASGAVFTGAWEDTLGVAGLQINLFADQAMTVQMQQSTDGVNADQKGAIIAVAFNTGFYRTYQATGSFFRVVLTNAGLNATTALRLQTALCPVVEAVPAELSDLGNLKVAVKETVGALETGGKLEKIINYFMQQQVDLMQRQLVELRIHTVLLGQGLNVKDDPSLFRSDSSFLN